MRVGETVIERECVIEKKKSGVNYFLSVETV